MELTYRHLEGERHRHGDLIHSHAHAGAHTHGPEAPGDNQGEAGHTHGLLDPSIKRSKAGVRAVLLSLLVLGVAALAQVAFFTATGSIALLADLIHNFGDAATAIPVDPDPQVAALDPRTARDLRRLRGRVGSRELLPVPGRRHVRERAARPEGATGAGRAARQRRRAG